MSKHVSAYCSGLGNSSILYFFVKYLLVLMNLCYSLYCSLTHTSAYYMGLGRNSFLACIFSNESILVLVFSYLYASMFQCVG